MVPPFAHVLATITEAQQLRLTALLGVGFAIACFGHLISSRAVIAVGCAIFFLAAFLLPLLLYS
jgi:hypothetical protein